MCDIYQRVTNVSFRSWRSPGSMRVRLLEFLRARLRLSTSPAHSLFQGGRGCWAGPRGTWRACSPPPQSAEGLAGSTACDVYAECRGSFSRALASSRGCTGSLGESNWSSRPLSLSRTFCWFFLQVSNIPAPPCGDVQEEVISIPLLCERIRTSQIRLEVRGQVPHPVHPVPSEQS